VNVRAEQYPILPVEPLLVRCVPPREDMTGDEEAGICDPCDPATPLEPLHILAEETLPSPGSDELLLLCWTDVGSSVELLFEVLFLAVNDLIPSAVRHFADFGWDLKLIAALPKEGQEQGPEWIREGREVDGLKTVSVTLERGVFRRQQRPDEGDVVLGPDRLRHLNIPDINPP